MLGIYLQHRFDLDVWIVIVLGIIGFLTSLSTARSCLRSIRKEIDRISKDPLWPGVCKSVSLQM